MQEFNPSSEHNLVKESVIKAGKLALKWFKKDPEQWKKDDGTLVSKADIGLGAVGIPKFIKSEWIKDEPIIIDAGYHPEKCGDIELDGALDRSTAYTPVPGGVGPMTINTLILQTIEAAEKN